MKNIADALTMIAAAKNHNDLCLVVDQIDSLFMANEPEIEMTDEDWQDINYALSKHEFRNA